MKGYFLVEKIVPHRRPCVRHVRFIVLSSSKLYIVEPFDPYKMKRAIPFFDIKTITVDTHNSTLIRFICKGGYIAFFLTVRKTVLDELIKGLSEGVLLCKPNHPGEPEPRLTLERIFDPTQMHAAPTPSALVAGEGGVAGSGSVGSVTEANSNRASATAAARKDEAGLHEMSLHDYSVKNRVLVPLLKLVTDSGYTAQDIFEGSVDLPRIMRMFKDQIGAMADGSDKATYVVDFLLPMGSEFNGRDSKPYNLSATLTIEKILRLICKKQGLKRWQRFALRTLKGTEMHPDQTLGDYGLGTLLKSWRLRLVYSESSEGRFTKINTRIVESILAELFSRSMAIAEDRAITRAQLEEVFNIYYFNI